MRALAPWALAAALLNAGAARLPRPDFPRSTPVSLAGDGVVAGATLWSVGMRRLAADLAFVRLLVYYGTYEGEADHGEEGHVHHGPDYGTGRYEEVLPRCRRIAALDPYWSFPLLYGASALAFNLDRPNEASSLIEEGLTRQPRDRQLLAMLAAVGFHKKGDLAQALDRLMPAIEEGGAPTMLKNMAAYMNERAGRRDAAVRLYRAILESRDQSYHDNAVRGLARLGVRER